MSSLEDWCGARSAAAPDGTVLYLAKEDSLILSMLRRFIGPLFGTFDRRLAPALGVMLDTGERR